MMATNLAELAASIEAESPESVAEETPEFTCETCGKPLTYSGRGRKPKFCDEHKRGATKATGSTPRGSSDVQAAVSNLEMAYNAVVMGLTLIGTREAAKALSDAIPGLNESNARHLATDRELVKRINAVGKAGGRATFIASQVFTLAPVVMIAAKELAERRAERAADQGESPIPFAEFMTPDE